jgi:hypothetical protein
MSMSTSPQLRFSLRHRLDPVDRRDPVACARPWLGELVLGPDERRRLVRCLFGADVVVDEIMGGDFHFFAQRFTGFVDGPVEWWDVLVGEARRYELFLFGDGGGVLFDSGDARALGFVTARAWQGDVALAALLGHAQPPAADRWPQSSIAGIDFTWF